eukprot:gene4603-5045_t
MAGIEMAMAEDDFLWQCALSSAPIKDRSFIIPDGIDLEVIEDRPDFVTTSFCISPKQREEDEKKLTVQVLEERGEGVVDVIGGEVWEAALLLCALLRQEVSRLSAYNVMLELGSGVGLPALMLAHLLSQDAVHSKKYHHIVMTDYDNLLLRNLASIIPRQFPICSDCSPPTLENLDARTDDDDDDGSLCCHTRLSVAALDWTRFDQLVECGEAFIPELVVGEVDLVFGSALCYAPVHARLLYRLLHCLVTRWKCQEVIVLQIGDREGFQVLLSQLREGLAGEMEISTETVSEEVYRSAGLCMRSRIPSSALSLHEDQLVYEYVFPEDEEGGGNCKERLLRTNRESFCLLRLLRRR